MDGATPGDDLARAERERPLVVVQPRGAPLPGATIPRCSTFSPSRVWKTRDAGGDPEEFLVRYNIGGVHLDQAAFQKLRQEISLRTDNLQLPMIWGRETVRLYSGVVPLPSGGFQKLVVREGRVAHVDPRTFALKRWTDLPLLRSLHQRRDLRAPGKSEDAGSHAGAGAVEDFNRCPLL